MAHSPDEIDRIKQEITDFAPRATFEEWRTVLSGLDRPELNALLASVLAESTK